MSNSSELERASDEAREFLEQYLLQHAVRGVGRVLACQYVAPMAAGDKLQIAFAILDGYLRGEPEVDDAARHCVDQLLAALPHLARFGVTWFAFQG